MSDIQNSALQTEIDRLRLELKTIQAQSRDAGDQITVADYLLTRLAQLGVTVRVSHADARYNLSPAIAYVRCSWRF